MTVLHRKEYMLKRLEKKKIIGSLMDMSYGILSMQIDFFKLTIVLAGSLFLFCVIPNNNVANAVMTSLGIESVEALVYSFKIGIMLMPTFLIFIIWKALEISSIYLNK